MSYAYMIEGSVVREGSLPRGALRHDNGEWVTGLASASDEVLHACGYWEVTPATKPVAGVDYDPLTHRVERSISLPGGMPQEVWTVVALTQEEVESQLEGANAEEVETKLDQGLQVLRNYLTIESPTNQEIRDQVEFLTKGMIYIVRKLQNKFDGTVE